MDTITVARTQLHRTFGYQAGEILWHALVHAVAPGRPVTVTNPDTGRVLFPDGRYSATLRQPDKNTPAGSVLVQITPSLRAGVPYDLATYPEAWIGPADPEPEPPVIVRQRGTGAIGEMTLEPGGDVTIRYEGDEGEVRMSLATALDTHEPVPADDEEAATR